MWVELVVREHHKDTWIGGTIYTRVECDLWPPAIPWRGHNHGGVAGRVIAH